MTSTDALTLAPEQLRRLCDPAQFSFETTADLQSLDASAACAGAGGSPVGALVPAALAAVRPGGVVVCAGIHMSDIPSFPYTLLWGERRIVSVANLTRADGADFMRIAAQIPLRVHTQGYALTQAGQALDDLRAGRVRGAAVLIPTPRRQE